MKDIGGKADVFVEQIFKKVEENGKEKSKKKKGASQRKQQQNQVGSASPGRERGCFQTRGASEGSASSNLASSAGHSCSPYKRTLEDLQPSKVQGLFSSLELSDESHGKKLFHERAKVSDVSFSSLPSLPTEGTSETGGACGSSLHRNDSPSYTEGKFKRGNSDSCPSTISFSKCTPASPENGFLSFQKMEERRMCFMPHWSMQAVDRALERGDAFRAAFRVNVHNRLEAYCTVDGVPIDVLINGAAAQNRAIEGDVVAIVIDPVISWPRLKGSPACFSDSSIKDGSYTASEFVEPVDECSERKDDIDAAERFSTDTSCSLHRQLLSTYSGGSFAGQVPAEHHVHESTVFSVDEDHIHQPNEATAAVQKLAATVRNFPFKRPSGNVVAIINKSPRRDAVVGSLGVKQWISYREGSRKDTIGGSSKKNNSKVTFFPREYIQLTPMDGRLPKMMVPLRTLPSFKERLHKADVTVEMELVAAQIKDWKEDCFLPQAHFISSLGHGEDIETQIGAILFGHAIRHVEFSQESLSCLPKAPWKIPLVELEKRKDLRDLCVFTIDSSTATDLDDALSVERLSDDIIKVGVHIADVTYFVMPDTTLDEEAEIRSTCVYLLQHKVPMLPPVLSEGLGSLNPGVDRLAFSVVWEINRDGDILDQWIGHTVIHSCCKLSYQHAQDIIDGKLSNDSLGNYSSGLPELHGKFEWCDVIDSICALNDISKTLKKNRFKDGALWLDNPKLVLLFDEWGLPYDSKFCERTDSNFLVEELMLLANMTAAKVISKAFPDCALLRRHPEPNLRKLREFEKFCCRHGFELDTSSSGQLHQSLQKMREKLNNDPVLSDILVNYATKSMHLAEYFSTGQLKDRKNEWMHYSLSVPFYTHFTSPLRRYPDIIVHRTLNAVLEAEEAYSDLQKKLMKLEKQGQCPSFTGQILSNCFSGLHFDQEAAHSEHGRQVLREAALRQRVPGTSELAGVANYCNDRKLASRQVQEAGEKVYLWALLKRNVALISDARVLSLGPKFMSLYISKFAMERRIYYDEVEGLTVDWLEMTSTLVLDFCKPKRSHRRGNPGKSRALEDIAVIVDPGDLTSEVDLLDGIIDEINMEKVGSSNLLEEIGTDSENLRLSCTKQDPAVLPLTLRLLSSVPVSVHAIGGDNGPPDIGVKLYLSSYLN